MITCPWCGTHYETFQSNCDNCGGSLPQPVEAAPVSVEPMPATEMPLSPPLPPRKIPSKVMRRMLFTDAGIIAGGIFLFIGSIFFFVGALVLAIATAIVGVPFVGLSFIFLLVGGGLVYWRYENARQMVNILRAGQAALGEITQVAQNYHVRVNGRYPWVIQYRFTVHGQDYPGKLSTLSQPDLSHQPGRPVYVLYQHDNPEKNTLYPSPYGYYGL